MIRKIKSIYKPQYMKRPLLYKCYSRVIFALVICLAWFRFLNDGTKGIDFAFTIAAVFFFAWAWINYLRLDGVRFVHLMDGWRKKKSNRHWTKDMIDYTDEKIVTFDDLDNDEKEVIKFLANLIVALIYAVLTVITALI